MAALVAIGGLIAGSRWPTLLGAGAQAVAAGVLLGTWMYYLEGPMSDEDRKGIGLVSLTILFDLGVVAFAWQALPRRKPT